jgi:hypothetical protein
MEGYLLAVPEGKRTESKLAVQTKAIEMANYTITICSNENNFPKRYRWCLTNKIVDTAIEIMNDINTANSIYVSTKNDYELRREFQTKALAYTARLLGLMELAYVRFNIEDKRIRYWTQLVVDTRELIKKWKKSDSNRYKKYK